ncbi:MAG: NHL repeat-containing protein [Bacteroidota bacterium]
MRLFRVLLPLLVALTAGCEYGLSDPALKRLLNPTDSEQIPTVSGDGSAAVITRPSTAPSPADAPKDSFTAYAMAIGLSEPSDVAVDASGTLFIAETGTHRIRKIDALGRVTFYAGDGYVTDPETLFGRFYEPAGFGALQGSLYSPNALTLDSAGNLFVADTQNNRIRKVTTDGKMITVAGCDIPGFYGDGKAATSAGLKLPCGVAMDSSGNLLLADTSNNRIRKVDVGSLVPKISTEVGQGNAGFVDNRTRLEAQLNSPAGIATDASGNLFIADTYNNRIRKVTPAGVVSTVAGNGSTGSGDEIGDGRLAIEASLYCPQDVAVDRFGYLYIADTRHHRIRRVDPQGRISTIAGNGMIGISSDGVAATDARFRYPKGVAVGMDGTVYVADSVNNRIVELR